jgi:hypothetical protein
VSREELSSRSGGSISIIGFEEKSAVSPPISMLRTSTATEIGTATGGGKSAGRFLRVDTAIAAL